MDGVAVRLAGTFAVSVDGGPECGPGLGSRQARLLLSLLAARRGRPVPTDRIVEALWPQDPPRRPERAVATLVSRLRALLGAGVVVGGPDAYRLGDPPAVRVDLDEAARLADECRARQARGESALAAAAGRRACALLGEGPALPEAPDADWVAELRAEHTALLRATRRATTEALLGAAEIVDAVALAEAAVRADRLDEAAHRHLMAALHAAGEPARALTVYQRLCAELAEELGVDPAPETRASYEALLTRTGPPGPEGTAVRADAGLVGRSAELERLTAAWAAAAAGRPGLLVVAGPGGIGKTRLAGELVTDARATGGCVLTVRCYAGERSLFLQPLVEALGPQLAVLPATRLRALAGPRADALIGLWPDLGGAFGAVTGEHVSAEIERRRVFEAITAVLRGLAAERPTLLLLDDLHNAGQATVELLHYLSRHAAPARLLVLATLRTGEGDAALDALAEVAARLEVGPLPSDAVDRLAEAAGQGAHGAMIMRRTRGHPLFVVETLRRLAEGETGPPETLQAAVLAQVRRTGPEVEAVLRAGAVLGAEVDPGAVAGLLDLAPHAAAERCARAADAGLLTVAGRTYEFVNDLVQEVLYGSTPLPVRHAHHRRAADLFTPRPELVGRHAVAADDWPRAARAFLLAGEQALARFATADAEALSTRALEAAERADVPELVCRALLARGHARDAQGAFRTALDDFRFGLAAARQAGDRRHEMRALRTLGGHTPIALGAPVQEAVARLQEGLTIATSLGDREAEADLLARLAVLHTNRLRFADAIRYGQRAAAAGRAARSDRALALGLDGLKNAYAYLGEVRALTAVVDELEPLLRHLGHLEWLQWTVFESAVPAIAAARWDDAERRVGEAWEISRRGGFVGAEPFFVAHLGWLARLQGRLDVAVEHGRVAVEQTHRVPQTWFGSSAQALLGTTLLECGDTARAVELLHDAVRQAGVDGAEAYRLRCLAPLAEATGDRTALAEADALLAAVDAPPGSAYLLGADAYLAVARAWLRAGEPARARRVLAPLLDAARRLDWIPVLVTAGLVDASAADALGDPAAAAAHGAAAVLAAEHGMAGVLQPGRNAAATPADRLTPDR